MIFDWNAGTITDKDGTRPMPAAYFGPVCIIDDETGAEVRDVLTYDTDRQVVCRLLLDVDGLLQIDAERNCAATITEQRKLTIIPNRLGVLRP